MNKKEKFLEKNKTAQALYNVITSRSEKPLYKWTDDDLDRYMVDNQFISANTIQTYLYLIRQLRKFECEENNVDYIELNLKSDPVDYVDIPRLRSKTIISPEEYWGIRNELIYYGNDGLEHNFRDVTLLHLSFLGLTSKEIQYLKEKDIEISEDKKKITLHLCSGREVIVDNSKMIEDILLAAKEDQYIKAKEYETHKREDKMDYVWSEYLIKNIANGNSESGEPIKHPGRMLQRNLEKLSHPVLDMAHLSVEDIRRSFILMLVDENESTHFAQISLGKKQQGDLIWLKKIKKRLLEYEAKRKSEDK